MPVAKPLPPEQRLASTTFVKLPPKTSAPAFISLVPKPAVVPDKTDPPKVAPPLLPPKLAEPARPAKPAEPPKPAEAPKLDKKKTGIIKLNTPVTATPEDSVFADIPEPAAPPVPEGWNKLHTGELPLPPEGLKETDPFQQSRRLDPKPKPATPVPASQDAPIAKPKPAAPPQAPPLVVEAAAPEAKSEPTLNPARGRLIAGPSGPRCAAAHGKGSRRSARQAAAAAFAGSQLARGAQGARVKKRRTEARHSHRRSAALAGRQAQGQGQAQKNRPHRPCHHDPHPPSPARASRRPALRPAVLPTRLRSTPEIPVPPVDAPAETTAKSGAIPAVEPAAKSEAVVAPEPAKDSKETTEPEKTSAQESTHLPTSLPAAAEAAALAAVTASKKKAPSLPPTRAERAKKRRLRGVIAFWVFVPIVAVALFLGILYFGRDTRVEGQVIPPDGMSLADEVWIVSDFTSLAAGVADDVAKERVPLQLAIQEAQDHVQRVQADIATREERIRLIQDSIQSAKDDITALVKKAQSDAQAIYDNQGKELDDEYNSKMAALKQDHRRPRRLPQAPVCARPRLPFARSLGQLLPPCPLSNAPRSSTASRNTSGSPTR